jgi:hypothetical protein
MQIVKRKKVSIIFLNKPNYDEEAIKYLILYMNKIQSIFEFEFPATEDNIFSKINTNLRETIFIQLQEIIQESDIFSDYYIFLTTNYIEDNLYWLVMNNKTIVTTNAWQKYFVPPSLFEYILHSIASTLTCMAGFDFDLGSHNETRGCSLDYTYNKNEKKSDIILGYICDECKTNIINNLGEDYLEAFQKITDLSWLGDIKIRGSVANNLYKYFKVSLDKDTGFNKSYFEKIKGSFETLPKDIILLMISSVIATAIGFWMSRLFQ